MTPLSLFANPYVVAGGLGGIGTYLAARLSVREMRAARLEGAERKQLVEDVRKIVTGNGKGNVSTMLETVMSSQDKLSDRMTRNETELLAHKQYVHDRFHDVIDSLHVVQAAVMTPHRDPQ